MSKENVWNWRFSRSSPQLACNCGHKRNFTFYDACIINHGFQSTVHLLFSVICYKQGKQKSSQNKKTNTVNYTVAIFCVQMSTFAHCWFSRAWCFLSLNWMLPTARKMMDCHSCVHFTKHFVSNYIRVYNPICQNQIINTRMLVPIVFRHSRDLKMQS